MNEVKITTEPASNFTKEELAKANVKKVKSRSIEALEKVAPKDFTQAEAINYIKHLRSQCTMLDNKVKALEANSKSAFEKYRISVKAYNTMRADYSELICQVNSMMKNAVRSMHDRCVAFNLEQNAKSENFIYRKED